MRILIVNNLYPPHSRGGAETAVVNEARHLADAGHEVTVLTTVGGLRALKPQETTEEGIRVIRFFPFNLFWYRNDYKHAAPVRALWHFFCLSNWHANAVLKRVIKDLKPNVVHLHNINGMSYAYPRITERMGVRTVFTVHAVHYAVPSGVIIRGKPIPKMFTPFAAILRRKLNTKAIITAPSHWLLDFYLARGFFKGQQLHVVPNPLGEERAPDFEEPRGGAGLSAPSESAIRAEIESTRVLRNGRTILDSPPRFLYVGQLETYKGINVMLAALRQLPSELRWQLDIAGDGSMMTELRKQRDQHIRIRGKLSGDELSAAYESAQLLIMPSLCEENAPMVIAEAQAHGLPVAASAIGGIPEMVEDGKTGMLFPPGNVDELTMHCRRALEHPEILVPMRQAAKKSAGRYAPALVAGEYLKLF